MIRHFWVRVHRCAGLAMAGFLIVVGLTGSLLAFLPELDRWLAPEWYPPLRAGTPLDPGILAERAQALVPHAQVSAVYLHEPERAEVRLSPRTDAATGKPFTLMHDRILLDPVTGDEIGRRNFGALSEGIANAMSFVYALHYELALGTFGLWALGIAALVWTLDCFVGAYLTLPAGRRQARGFWERWRRAWKIKARAGFFRLNFDLHRAGGLWLCAVLLVFAWSSVYMNLWDTVYTWATRSVLDYRTYWTELSVLPRPVEQPRLGWREAGALARRLLDEEGGAHGFRVKSVVAMRLDRLRNVYSLQVRTDREIQDRRGVTTVFIDADTGALRLALRASGQYGGNTVTNWLMALHMANVFGLPYRIFICVLGLAIAALSITGVVVWARKRAGRAPRRRRMRAPVETLSR
jgi:uncharacterized iron-regulated membrane protein